MGGEGVGRGWGRGWTGEEGGGVGGGEGGKLFRVACWCHFQTNGKCNMCCPNFTNVLPKCVAQIVAQIVAQKCLLMVAQKVLPKSKMGVSPT